MNTCSRERIDPRRVIQWHQEQRGPKNTAQNEIYFFICARDTTRNTPRHLKEAGHSDACGNLEYSSGVNHSLWNSQVVHTYTTALGGQKRVERFKGVKYFSQRNCYLRPQKRKIFFLVSLTTLFLMHKSNVTFDICYKRL